MVDILFIFKLLERRQQLSTSGHLIPQDEFTSLQKAVSDLQWKNADLNKRLSGKTTENSRLSDTNAQIKVFLLLLRVSGSGLILQTLWLLWRFLCWTIFALSFFGYFFIGI
jgi:hypothetical protein